MDFLKFIYLLLGSFVLLIGALVFQSVRQKDIHLVSKDYYKEELSYQNTIEALRRTPKMCISLNNDSGVHTLVFNDGLMQSVYHPSDSLFLSFKRNESDKEDKLLVLHSTAPLALNFLSAGRWNVVVKWKNNGKDFLWKENVYL